MPTRTFTVSMTQAEYTVLQVAVHEREKVLIAKGERGAAELSLLNAAWAHCWVAWQDNDPKAKR